MGRLATVWALLALAVSAADAEPLRILLVTGGHSYDNAFHSVFEQPEADWRVTINPHPAAFSGDIRGRYDAVVLYDMTSEVDEERRKNLRAYVEAGGGLLVLHHAILDYQDWPWFEQTVGGKYLESDEGEDAASTYLHDVEMVVRVVAKHPVTAGLEDFRIEDETYGGMRISDANRVLLETDEKSSDGPVAWVSSYPRARVVYVQLGHGPAAHRDAHFRRLVRNAIEWVAEPPGR